MSMHSRRSFLAATMAAAATPFLMAEGIPLPRNLSGVIKAGDPGADKLVVYNRKTGEEMHMVTAVCVKDGWIEQLRMKPNADGKMLLCVDENGDVIRDVIEGPWAIRPGSLKRGDTLYAMDVVDGVLVNMTIQDSGEAPARMSLPPMPTTKSIFG